MLLEQLLTRAGGGAAGSTNEAVRANAEVAVADAGYQLGGKGNFCVLIRQKDEVVTGAVTLGEGQACQLAPDGRVLAHMLSLRLVTCPFMILPRRPTRRGICSAAARYCGLSGAFADDGFRFVGKGG